MIENYIGSGTYSGIPMKVLKPPGQQLESDRLFL